MSISPTSSSFNFDGVVSGLNTSSIITQLLSLDKAPLTALQNQQTKVQTRDSAYQALKSQVSAFQTAVSKLLLNSNVNVKAASSATASVATATATSDALNGTYQLNVTRLATASTISSGVWDATNNKWTTAPIGAGLDDGSTSGTTLANAGFATPVTAGQFTINGVAVTIDPTTQTLDQVVQQINSTVTSVQASVTTDANGHKNFITLHSLDGKPIQLGAGDDTSNFLAAAHLVSTGTTADIASSVPLGSANTSSTLANAHLGTALSGTGSFMVNGQTITWDASKDTISSVLNKINASTANVQAVYDPTSDSVKLTNKNTGSQSITLSNDTGGFLAAMHLMGGSVSGVSQQTLGTTAQFSINGGPAMYSNSNTVTGALNGVSISLASTGSTSLTISQDTSTTVTNVQAFATAFNSLVDAIDADTKYDAANNKASVLTGDSSVQGLEDQIRSILANAAPSATGAYKTLADLGISTGAYGSAVGTTNHLTVDTTKLTAALQADPNAVYSVLAGQPAAVLNPNSSGAAQAGSWISSISGTPFGGTYGTYRVTTDASGNLSSVFTPSGSSPYTPATGTIAPPAPTSSNSTLIAGLTLTTSGLPASGSATDTIWYGQPGILGRLNDFLTQTLGTTGLFATESNNASTELQDLGDQINNANEQLAERQQTLQEQFTAMETALAQLNMQSSSLISSMGGGASMLPSSSGSK